MEDVGGRDRGVICRGTSVNEAEKSVASRVYFACAVDFVDICTETYLVPTLHDHQD